MSTRKKPLTQFGFDSLFFGRLDYQDKDLRQNTQTMEMIWRGSPANLGNLALARTDLFTGVLQDGYGPPGGFCFDIYCGDPDIKVHFPAKHYTTNHLMVTMGSDFQYQAAHNWYKNLDKLIAYVNQKELLTAV
ncbi:hypothetical protein C0Q70_01087 [Pomacea canaliculata]|uniref:Glycoside hydrolase family 38 N-terminal domain-containing protein n=1 Tax=Pomacea canaliculata TaxID=400727 RepID=A0A2T7PYG8_POMCA|nr:hypothetical protein C0Q70_01087 [Pomacea canaliculata]